MGDYEKAGMILLIIIILISFPEGYEKIRRTLRNWSERRKGKIVKKNGVRRVFDEDDRIQ